MVQALACSCCSLQLPARETNYRFSNKPPVWASSTNNTTVTLPASPSSSSSSSSSPFSLSIPAIHHPWLIVGTGNPGKKYQGTRHNIGFEMIDAFAESEGIKLNTLQQKALIGKGEIGPSQVLLAKPQTYVNLTGESIGPLAAYYHIPVHQILVIYDEMELDFGEMRLSLKGGYSAHSGLQSISEHIKKTRLFPRLRIGIGKPPGAMEPAAYLLQKFDITEREEMDYIMTRGIKTIRQAVIEGAEKAASIWNELPKSRMRLTSEELKLLKGC